MATKHHKSKSRPPRNRAMKAAAPSAAIEEIIQNERARLMKAHSVLGCVIRAMEGEGICTGKGPYWPAAIESASDLIDESIKRLELGAIVNAVREPATVYGTDVGDGDGTRELSQAVH